MKLKTKIAVAAGAGGGISATGYAIYNSSESEIKESEKPFKPGSVGEKILNSGFEIVDLENSKNKEFCKLELSEGYDFYTYENSVKACAKEQTFEQRAKALNIELIGNNQELLSSRKTAMENSFAFFNESSTAMVSLTNGLNEEKIKEYCSGEGKVSLENSIFPAHLEWTNYIKICAKQSDLEVNFWTGEKVS